MGACYSQKRAQTGRYHYTTYATIVPPDLDMQSQLSPTSRNLPYARSTGLRIPGAMSGRSIAQPRTGDVMLAYAEPGKAENKPHPSTASTPPPTKLPLSSRNTPSSSRLGSSRSQQASGGKRREDPSHLPTPRVTRLTDITRRTNRLVVPPDAPDENEQRSDYEFGESSPVAPNAPLPLRRQPIGGKGAHWNPRPMSGTKGRPLSSGTSSSSDGEAPLKVKTTVGRLPEPQVAALNFGSSRVGPRRPGDGGSAGSLASRSAPDGSSVSGSIPRAGVLNTSPPNGLDSNGSSGCRSVAEKRDWFEQHCRRSRELQDSVAPGFSNNTNSSNTDGRSSSKTSLVQKHYQVRNPGKNPTSSFNPVSCQQPPIVETPPKTSDIEMTSTTATEQCLCQDGSVVWRKRCQICVSKTTVVKSGPAKESVRSQSLPVGYWEPKAQPKGSSRSALKEFYQEMAELEDLVKQRGEMGWRRSSERKRGGGGQSLPTTPPCMEPSNNWKNNSLSATLSAFVRDRNLSSESSKEEMAPLRRRPQLQKEFASEEKDEVERILDSIARLPSVMLPEETVLCNGEGGSGLETTAEMVKPVAPSAIEEEGVSSPVKERSGTSPVNGGRGTSPVKERSGTSPVNGGRGTSPVNGGSVSSPVKGGSGTSPVNGGSVSSPVIRGSVTSPTSQSVSSLSSNSSPSKARSNASNNGQFLIDDEILDQPDLEPDPDSAFQSVACPSEKTEEEESDSVIDCKRIFPSEDEVRRSRPFRPRHSRPLTLPLTSRRQSSSLLTPRRDSPGCAASPITQGLFKEWSDLISQHSSPVDGSDEPRSFLSDVSPMSPGLPHCIPSAPPRHRGSRSLTDPPVYLPVDPAFFDTICQDASSINRLLMTLEEQIKKMPEPDPDVVALEHENRMLKERIALLESQLASCVVTSPAAGEGIGREQPETERSCFESLPDEATLVVNRGTDPIEEEFPFLKTPVLIHTATQTQPILDTSRETTPERASDIDVNRNIPYPSSGVSLRTSTNVPGNPRNTALLKARIMGDRYPSSFRLRMAPSSPPARIGYPYHI